MMDALHNDDSPAEVTTTGLRPSIAKSSDETRTSTSSMPQGARHTADEETEKAYQETFAHFDPTSGFAYIDGDVGGPGYNETNVDIVTVPCPGAHPVETWAREPFPDGFFGLPRQDTALKKQSALKELAGDVILSPALDRHLPKAAHLWVRQGIRKFVSNARIAMYRHRELTKNTDLSTLADDLLEKVAQLRGNNGPPRPLFFIAHSVGGLVVKLAILKASRSEKYHGIWYNCHGVSFFATPHRGSSYLSMRNLSESIQSLLHLQHPLPRSMSSELRVGRGPLLKLHEDFTDIASELRIWTFYETIDSQLSGSGYGLDDEVRFSAPLVSIKSSLVGVRQEQVYSLDSDHSHCASFGTVNKRTLGSYLEDLSEAVKKAQDIATRYVHTPLNLGQHVKVELIGFYEDPDAEMESAMRLYTTRYHLSEFLEKGPERCLEERLTKVSKHAPGRQPVSKDKPPSSRGSGGRDRGNTGLGLWTNVQKMWKSSGPESPSSQAAQPRGASPDIFVTRPSAVQETKSLPADAMRHAQSLTVPPLSSPGFNRPASRASTASTVSEPTIEDVSPKSGQPTKPQEFSPSSFEPTSTVDQKDFDHTAQSRAARVSKGFALQDLQAGFSRPDPKRRRFMWIHLPFTNPSWVKEIFTKLSESHSQNFSKLFNNENWVSRHVIGRHSQSQPTFVKPACNYIAADSAQSPRPSSGNTGRNTGAASPNYLYLYLPYLNFDTYYNMIRRRNMVKRRLRHGRARPTPKDVAELESLELKVIWKYLAFDPPLNPRRTLDQFGFPSLQDTYARDDDQMLFKLTKEDGSTVARKGPRRPGRDGDGSVVSPVTRTSSIARAMAKVLDPEKTDDESASEPEEVEYKNGNVLMVDQLWLWAIDTTTLATFFPKRESRPKEGTLFQQADLRNSVYNELNGDLTGRTENALDLAAFIALHAVTVLLDRTSHPDLDIFRIFEEAIGLLTERMTMSLKQFRMQTFKRVDVGDSDSDDPDDNKSKSIKKRHKREMEQAEKENRENTSAILELRDMEDELSTLLRLFDTQTSTIRTMRSIYVSDELKDSTTNGRAYLDEALGRLDDYKQQTTEMLKRVDTTRKDFEKLLEMAQRQAQLDDVRWSRLQTELASSSNLSVMIFTIFTVIFLPLSFFTSVFGMNTREWGGDDNLPLSIIWSVTLPISAMLILAALVAAFSTHVQTVFKSTFRSARDIVGAGRRFAKKLEPEAARQAKIKRREWEEQVEYLTRKKKERNYDFWATVKRQRNSEYQIPDVNRKGDRPGLISPRRTWRSKGL